MIAYSPHFAIPYQSLRAMFELDPEGMVGEDGALAIDAAMKALAVRLDTIEASLALRAAMASRVTTQLIPNATETDVTLPVEDKDTSLMFTPGNALITVPAGGGGTWTCIAWTVWATGATAYRRIGLSKNGGVTAGTDIWYVVQPNNGGSADVGQVMVKELDLVPGDNIRIKALHAQGASLNINFAALSLTRKPG